MIKGLKLAIPEGGKIKIGGKGKMIKSRYGKDFRQPIKYDHLLVTKTTKGADDNFEIDHDIMDECPKDADGKVRQLPICLHSDDLEEVFPTQYAWYKGKKLACSGDGETATRWRFNGDERLSENKSISCPCNLLEEDENGAKKCKPNGTLNCSIALPGTAIAGVVHKWRTTSVISIKRMLGSMYQILSTIGTIKGVPLWLKLESVDTNKGKVYCFHVELRAKDLQEAQRNAIESSKMRLMLSDGAAKALKNYEVVIDSPAALDEPDDVQEDIQEEFYPEEEAPRLHVDDAPREKTKRGSNKKSGVSVLKKAAGKRDDVETGKTSTETSAHAETGKAEKTTIQKKESTDEEPPHTADGEVIDFGGPE